ncbi:MAG TPA: cytochrome c3 family protein [Thermoanaerobaculia bacterium]
MRKTLPVIVAILFCFSGSTMYAETFPKQVTIGEAAKKQPAVPLDHEKHATKLVKSCDTCHHTNKGLTKENEKDVKKCSACHLDPQGKVPGMRETSLTANPMHTSCMSCHKAEKKGPVACTACHVKK